MKRTFIATVLASLAAVLHLGHALTRPDIAPWIWGSLFAVGGIFELAAIANSGYGDTLSEQIWALRQWLPARVAFYSFWSWMTWHFILEPHVWSPLVRGPQLWRDDLLVLAFGVALALLYVPQPMAR